MTRSAGTTMRDLEPAPRNILIRAGKLSDRQLLALGAAWQRTFGKKGYPPSEQLDRIAVAFRSYNGRHLGERTLTGNAYIPISKRAGECGERVLRRDRIVRDYAAPKDPSQCVRMAIEAAAVVACLAPYYGPDDALAAELQLFSAPWRRVVGDEPLLSLINAPYGAAPARARDWHAPLSEARTMLTTERCPDCGHLPHGGRCPGFANCGCESLCIGGDYPGKES